MELDMIRVFGIVLETTRDSIRHWVFDEMQGIWQEEELLASVGDSLIFVYLYGELRWPDEWNPHHRYFSRGVITDVSTGLDLIDDDLDPIVFEVVVVEFREISPNRIHAVCECVDSPEFLKICHDLENAILEVFIPSINGVKEQDTERLSEQSDIRMDFDDLYYPCSQKDFQYGLERQFLTRRGIRWSLSHQDDGTITYYYEIPDNQELLALNLVISQKSRSKTKISLQFISGKESALEDHHDQLTTFIADDCRPRWFPEMDKKRRSWAEAWTIIIEMRDYYFGEEAFEGDDTEPSPREYQDGISSGMQWKPSERTMRNIKKAGKLGWLDDYMT